jgi:hypothetical protein
MSVLTPVAGSRIAIGPAVTDVPDDDDITLTEFTAITTNNWTDIDGWQTMGAHGDSKTLITEPLINRKRDAKTGGTTNGGSMQNNFIILRDDPGQIAVRVAAKTNYNYPVRITYDDAPPGVGSTPTVEYFYAIVMSASEQGGGANTAQMLQATFEINSASVYVPADVA